MSDDPDATIDLQAQPKAYFVVGIVIGVPALVMLIEFLRGVRGAGPLLLLFLGLAVLGVAWIRGFRLKLSSDRLEYRTLLGRHSVALDEIEDSFEEFGRSGKHAQHRLVVVPRASTGKRRFVITVAAFEPTRMKRVYGRLGTRPVEFD